MFRQPLASTAIVSAGYDPDTQQLELEFRNGRIYRYSDVPRGVYDFLLRTPSKGGYVNRMIDGKYAHQDITPAPPEQDLAQVLSASLSEAGKRQD
jgi:hypothetical protein